MFNDNGNERREETANLNAKLLARISAASSKDSAQNVATPDVIGHATVTEGKRQGADMVCNHAIGSINTVHILSTKLALVWAYASQLLDPFKDGGKDISVVVGAPVLDDRDKSLETHTSVDMLRWQGL
jgi:hypothetical protein